MSAASIRNTPTICRRVTPSALSKPTSRVRSDTETSITFMIPMPATLSETAAIPARAAVNAWKIWSKVDSTASWVSTVTSSSPSCRSVNSATTASRVRSMSRCERTWARMRNRLVRLNSRRAASTGMSTTSSRSRPMEVPRGASTPITRKRISPSRIISPSGLRLPNSSRCTLAPSTQTGASSSSGGKKRPTPIFRLRISSTSWVVPNTVTSRLRSPNWAGAVPMATGATFSSWGISRASAVASATVRSLGAVFTKGVAPKVSVLPGMTMSRLVPSDENSPVTYRRAPSPRLVSRITEATPMATPHREKTVRRRCPRSPPKEKRSRSEGFMGTSLSEMVIRRSLPPCRNHPRRTPSYHSLGLRQGNWVESGSRASSWLLACAGHADCRSGFETSSRSL